MTWPFWTFIGFIAFWGIMEFLVMIRNNREKERLAKARLAEIRRKHEEQWQKIEDGIRDLYIEPPDTRGAPSASTSVDPRGMD